MCFGLRPGAPTEAARSLTEPAAVALLRLCVRLAHRDGLLDAVLPALEPALDVELDVGARRALAEQTTAGVLLLTPVMGSASACSLRKVGGTALGPAGSGGGGGA